MAACRVCAQSRASHRPLTGLFHPLPVPNCSRSKVVVNFVTRLPPSEGNTVILTIMAYPSLSILSPYPSFRWLLRRRISLLFTCSGSIGIPVDIASDRGPQFASQVCQAFCRGQGATLCLTSGYHHQKRRRWPSPLFKPT